MADYYPLLARAVAVLPSSTIGARQAIYGRARDALLAQLRAIDPPIDPGDIQAESDALDAAAAKVEADLAAKSASDAKAEPAAAVPAPAPVANAPRSPPSALMPGTPAAPRRPETPRLAAPAKPLPPRPGLKPLPPRPVPTRPVLPAATAAPAQPPVAAPPDDPTAEVVQTSLERPVAESPASGHSRSSVGTDSGPAPGRLEASAANGGAAAGETPAPARPHASSCCSGRQRPAGGGCRRRAGSDRAASRWSGSQQRNKSRTRAPGRSRAEAAQTRIS